MATRKTNKRPQKKTAEKIIDNSLPQNIVMIGEHVEEDKNIYISQQVYKDIHKFTMDKTSVESGGMLIGTVIEEFGKTNIIIRGFVEAKHSEGTPTTLKFTHETWEYVHREVAKKYPEMKIVGWIHTHPNFGIFLSEYDKFIQENFFKEDSQIAYVVDPIQDIEGFYFWINGKIERCKGFYIFDKTGVKITISNEKEEDKGTASPKASPFSLQNIVIGILSVLVIVLLVTSLSLSNRIKEINEQQRTLAESANNSLFYMHQQIAALSSELEEMKVSLETPQDDPQLPEETEDATVEPTEQDTSTEVDENQESTEQVPSEEPTNDQTVTEPASTEGADGNE